MKYIYILLGSFFALIGFIGIVVPGLPTTPFLLLSAALYIRSSKKLYMRLISSRLFGRYIKDFQERKGMTLITKLWSLAVMWVMIIVSILLIKAFFVKITLLILGIIGTVVMGFVIKTITHKNHEKATHSS